MTFCLGIRVDDGLVGIADTRVTSGTEVITARKVSIYQHDRHSMFLMTSGLRSVRDKALTYFNEIIEEADERFSRLYQAVNAFGEAIRRVASEDRRALADSGVNFDVSCLVGGQLEDDGEHKLYLLYPQGNWVEIGEGTPFHIIGESGYGKPIMVRALNYHDSIRHALQVGALAFDSTRISATDVDFPVDVVIYLRDRFEFIEHRLTKDDLREVSDWWQERLRQGVSELPDHGLRGLLDRLPDKDAKA